MRQYKDAKEAYPDAILFFRLGDFYEMFNEDAVLASELLSLTLTARNKDTADPVPMAGVPHHSAHQHLGKLIAEGHKVAICEQMADPSTVKGIVPRKVVRVLTPGLLTDIDHLNARQNNYLCAVEADGERFGLARLDLSTGDLAACPVVGKTSLIAELARSEPAEVLLPVELEELRTNVIEATRAVAPRQDDPLAAEEVEPLLSQGVAAPLYDDAVRHHEPVEIRAVARALRFAHRNLPDQTLPIRRLVRYDPRSSLHIDETAQAHLELVRGADGKKAGSLLSVIDETVTPAGARMLRRQLLAPLTDVLVIGHRLDAVELFVNHVRARAELREILREVGDLERLVTRASLGEATPRELGQLRRSLNAVPRARDAIVAVAKNRVDDSAASALELDVDPLPELAAELSRALVDDPPVQPKDLLREGYDEELDGYRRLRTDGSKLITDLEQRLRRETDIPSLKVKFTRAFGWYIEVTKTHLDKVPETWRRRQTLVAAERYLNDELDELADRLMGAEEKFGDRERTLFRALVGQVSDFDVPLRKLARAVGQWDVSSALAEVAQSRSFCRPVVDRGTRLELKDARHPVVEQFVRRGQFVPNDTVLDTDGDYFCLLTGPNMAGKSTLMRQVALCVLLAQAGSFVPAAEAHVGVVDRVLSRVGASDNLARGESTFMVEMRETAAILGHATDRSLVILDEIGRGTSTFDGLAIAWAVTEHLGQAVKCRTLFATHYHQLTELGERLDGVANFSVSAREHDGSIVFLHRLTPGAVSKSYGIAVARLAGLPEAVLRRAEAVLAALEGEAETPGGPAPLAKAPHPQLTLFGPGGGMTPPRPRPETPAISPAQDQALTRLAELDVARTTPLEALQLLDELQRSLK